MKKKKILKNYYQLIGASEWDSPAKISEKYGEAVEKLKADNPPDFAEKNKQLEHAANVLLNPLARISYSEQLRFQEYVSVARFAHVQNLAEDLGQGVKRLVKERVALIVITALSLTSVGLMALNMNAKDKLNEFPDQFKQQNLKDKQTDADQDSLLLNLEGQYQVPDGVSVARSFHDNNRYAMRLLGTR